MRIRTSPYRLSRFELAKLATIEYFTTFWWFAIVVPAFGIVAAVFGSGALQLVGFMGILWPMTIPGRAMLTTTKAARLFTKGCTMEADDRQAVFIGEQEGDRPRLRYVLPYDRLRTPKRRGEFLLLRDKRLGFVPIRLSAFENSADADDLTQTILQAIGMLDEPETIAGDPAEPDASNPALSE